MLALTFSILPWQQKYFQQLQAMLNSSRCPQAMLISGAEGIGKTPFIRTLIAHLLCSSSTKNYCGHCQSCLWLAHQYHPDLLWIAPESDNAMIKIDQIRAIQDFLNLSAHLSRKIVVIENAHLLNINAANALLKTLEEPPQSALLFLITPFPSQLSLTIKSRLQHFPLSTPDFNTGLNWLKQQLPDFDEHEACLRAAHHAPLKALSNQQQGIFAHQQQLTQQFLKILQKNITISDSLETWTRYPELSLDHLMTQLYISLYHQHVDQTMRSLYFPSSAEHTLFNWLTSYHHDLLFKQYQSLIEIKRHLRHNVRLDWQLEAWFLTWLMPTNVNAK